MSESTAPNTNVEPLSLLIVRLDEKVSTLTALFKEYRTESRKDFDEVWQAVNNLRTDVAALANKQATAEGQKSGANWLLQLIVGAPGLAALLAFLAEKQ